LQINNLGFKSKAKMDVYENVLSLGFYDWSWFIKVCRSMDNYISNNYYQYFSFKWFAEVIDVFSITEGSPGDIITNNN